MLTNAHILAINDRIGAARMIVHKFPESSDKQLLITLLDDMYDHLFCANNDLSNAQQQIADLTRELYEPVMKTQSGDSFRYISVESIERTSEPTEVIEEIPHCFSLLTEQCIKENKTKAVEAEIRAACKGTAPALWKTLRTYEALGYVSIQNIDAQVIYDAIVEYFGELPYKERNFRKARFLK